MKGQLFSLEGGSYKRTCNKGSTLRTTCNKVLPTLLPQKSLIYQCFWLLGSTGSRKILKTFFEKVKGHSTQLVRSLALHVYIGNLCYTRYSTT
nr:MAG TPA: hypothetical protein [Caudoviricetes sp.]